MDPYDYFAGMAMQAMIQLSHPGYGPWSGSEDEREGTAMQAFAMAESMMKEREERCEMRDYRRKYEELCRKVAHGCTDSFCEDCDE